MPKPNPEEVWRQLADEAGDDAVDEAANVSVAQAEKELAAAGFDVAADRATAEAFLRELERGSPLRELEAGPPLRGPRRPRSVVIVLSVAAALAAAGAVLYFATKSSPHDEARPRLESSESGLANPKP